MAFFINPKPWNPILILSLILLLSQIIIPCHGSDPDPLQDFCIGDLTGPISFNGFPCKLASNVTSNDFFFDGFVKEGNTTNQFGFSATFGNVLSFPGLNTLGVSMNRVDFAPGGVNPPHSHPRATESGILVHGKLLVGFFSTSNVFYSKTIGPGEMFVIPRGLVHFQMNVGEEKALIYTAFNSHLPGFVVVAPTLFGSRPPVPDEVLSKAFQVDGSVIEEIKAKFGA